MYGLTLKIFVEAALLVASQVGTVGSNRQAVIFGMALVRNALSLLLSGVVALIKSLVVVGTGLYSIVGVHALVLTTTSRLEQRTVRVKLVKQEDGLLGCVDHSSTCITHGLDSHCESLLERSSLDTNESSFFTGKDLLASV